MRVAVGVAGCLLLIIVLLDVFNTIILARRTRNTFRITRALYALTWRPFSAMAKRIRSSRRRESLLGAYGPLSLLILFSSWAFALVLAFAALQWAAGMEPAGMRGNAGNDLFLSATTLFTLQTGDPKNGVSRLITAIEGGIGFSLFGLVVGYLPVFYQAFSRRELQISLLDARAGSPPSAIELLRIEVSSPGRIERYMELWEQWAAEILENQLSFPMMALFRSHHANQSWLTALTAITDCAAVVSLCSEGDLKIQAEFTFAMGRHALTDIAARLRLKLLPANERLTPNDFKELIEAIEKPSSPLKPAALLEKDLADLRAMYEPHALALGSFLLMAIPEWHRSEFRKENWKERGKHDGEMGFAVSDPYSRKEGS